MLAGELGIGRNCAVAIGVVAGSANLCGNLLALGGVNLGGGSFSGSRLVGGLGRRGKGKGQRQGDETMNHGYDSSGPEC